MATTDGIRAVLDEVGATQAGERATWFNLREEVRN
jgi:hypothetical protein